MPSSSLFPTDIKSRWTYYRVDIHVPGTMVGGIPKDPDTIRKFIKARMMGVEGLPALEMEAIVNETLQEMGWTRRPEELSPQEVDELTDAVVLKSDAKGNSFKSVEGQLVWEGRCLKAALNESANVCYPWVKSKTKQWPGAPEGNSKKFQNYLKERVEVIDTYIPLGRTEPDVKDEQRIKPNVSGPKGPRSVITVVDLVIDVRFSATIAVLDDCIEQKVWHELWSYVELGGIGADRGRGDGRCEITDWRRLRSAKGEPASRARRLIAAAPRVAAAKAATVTSPVRKGRTTKSA